MRRIKRTDKLLYTAWLCLLIVCTLVTFTYYGWLPINKINFVVQIGILSFAAILLFFPKKKDETEKHDFEIDSLVEKYGVNKNNG
jgi:hypothetical protein